MRFGQVVTAGIPRLAYAVRRTHPSLQGIAADIEWDTLDKGRVTDQRVGQAGSLQFLFYE
jgi:hypothetical protein